MLVLSVRVGVIQCVDLRVVDVVSVVHIAALPSFNVFFFFLVWAFEV